MRWRVAVCSVVSAPPYFAPPQRHTQQHTHTLTTIPTFGYSFSSSFLSKNMQYSKALAQSFWKAKNTGCLLVRASGSQLTITLSNRLRRSLVTLAKASQGTVAGNILPKRSIHNSKVRGLDTALE